MTPTRARLAIAGQTLTCDIAPGDIEATFELDLTATDTTTMDAYFASDTDECGAYYVYVERLVPASV